MTSKRVTLDEIFAELRAKNEASWNDPENARRREEASARRRAQIDAEIAAGLRDEDGELIAAEDADDLDDQDDDYDPDADSEDF
jgi:hypothetical protein